MRIRWVLSDNPADWLAWIQGLTTVALAVLTGIYVRLTARIAHASMRQANLSADSVAAAQQQVDSATLDRYLPIESAVATALGTVRGAKAANISVRYDFRAATFENAVHAADYIGGSFPPVMQIALVLLRSCQLHRDALVEALKTSAPNQFIITAHRESLELDLQVSETILQAASDALKPAIERLRASANRPDINFENLQNPRPN